MLSWMALGGKVIFTMESRSPMSLVPGPYQQVLHIFASALPSHEIGQNSIHQVDFPIELMKI